MTDNSQSANTATDSIVAPSQTTAVTASDNNSATTQGSENANAEKASNNNDEQVTQTTTKSNDLPDNKLENVTSDNNQVTSPQVAVDDQKNKNINLNVAAQNDNNELSGTWGTVNWTYNDTNNKLSFNNDGTLGTRDENGSPFNNDKITQNVKEIDINAQIKLPDNPTFTAVLKKHETIPVNPHKPVTPDKPTNPDTPNNPATPDKPAQPAEKPGERVAPANNEKQAPATQNAQNAETPKANVLPKTGQAASTSLMSIIGSILLSIFGFLGINGFKKRNEDK